MAPLAAGIAVTPANAAGTTAKAVVLKCHIELSTAPPAGSNIVSQPPADGAQYGAVHCPPVGTFGPGIEADSFTVPDSGDTVASYVQYFSGGSIHGKFDLTPQPAVLLTTNFASESWVGTVTVTGGTGSYAGARGKSGKLTCSSSDTVHLTCTEKLKLTAL
ncbi:MAG: hypothetical protein ABSG43_22495 [Solirubrobacteraceae bacterium]